MLIMVYCTLSGVNISFKEVWICQHVTVFIEDRRKTFSMLLNFEIHLMNNNYLHFPYTFIIVFLFFSVSTGITYG